MSEKTIISYQSEGKRIQLTRCVVYTMRNALGYVVRWQIKNNRKVAFSSHNEDEIRIRFANYLRDQILQKNLDL